MTFIIKVPLNLFPWRCTKKCGVAPLAIVSLWPSRGDGEFYSWANRDKPPHCPRCGRKMRPAEDKTVS